MNQEEKPSQKRNEQELRQADNLARMERYRSMGILSGGIAHHFNNLLSVILGYASFALNNDEVTEDISSALNKICEAAQQGRRMTEELLAFSGDEDDGQVCHVHDAITNVLSLLKSQVASGINVETHLDAKNDEVVAPPGPTHQILFNLFTNAFDSMASEGQLDVTTACIEMETDDGMRPYLRIEVSDSAGVLPAGAEQVAETIEMTEDFLPRDYMGLRLSSICGIVGEMDGTVVISSQPDSLTSVSVLLPVASQHVDEVETRQSTGSITPDLVWVVDDDKQFRDMCEQVFPMEGLRVVTMDGGPDLQKKWMAQEERPDLLIIDFSMPEYNGLELCEWLAEQKSTIPVVLISGLANTHPDIRRALEMDQIFFLQKPFSFREITDVISVAMA